MAYKEVSRVDIAEVIRRWKKGNSQRHIASGVGLSRDTVRKYLGAAKEAGISREGPDPTEEHLSRTGPRKAVAPAEGLLEPWGDQIYRWITVDRLQVTRIRELLDQRGCQVSYTSLRRFLQRRNWRGRSARTVRMEQSRPGEVAELDFGRLGVIQDQETGRRCTVWALIVVLAYSRHSFLWPTYSQKLEEVIAGLEAAWAFFGGIPQYLVIDNFPAAVAGADALHPKLTRGFLEYSQHRGFITDPARVRHPRDKPRVERGVQYVRERFFKGSDFKDLGPVHTIGLNMISLEDGTYRSSIRTNSSLSAGATRQREHVEPPSPQRNSVRRRAWLQVAGLASEVWLLAHSLYPHEPLVQKRSPQSGVRTPSTRADSAHQYRGGFGGQHDCQGASRWHGRVKKNGPQSIGKSRGGWTTKIHMVAADARTALMFSLSAGQAHDAPEGRKLLNRLGPQRENLSIVMDRAYEGNETRQLALALGFTPVVPPSSTRVSPWTYDMEMYKRRNEVERLFRRLKGFRRIFSRFEKLDVLFLGFILLTLIVDALR